MATDNGLQATEQPGEGGAVGPAGDKKERLETMAATGVSADYRDPLMQECEAATARRRYAPGAIRPAPFCEPFVSKPEDPLQSIFRDRERMFLTVKEAARVGEVTTQTILNLVKDGTLRACRFGKRRTLISLESFRACFRPWEPTEGEPTDEEEDAG